MTELDFQWNLRELMATRGMFSTTALRPELIERGITLSPSQVWRLVTEKPDRLNVKVLLALMDILDCRMDELIKPIRTDTRRRAAAGERSNTTTTNSRQEPGVGSFRPKRARITGDRP